MHFNYLGLAIPFFIGLIALEYYLAKKKGLNFFELHGTIANISIGIAERLADVLIAGLFYYVYDYLQKKVGLFTIKPSVGWWLLLFVLTDLIWYWYHRLAHEINLLWFVHIVHHQSNEYNFSVSARITVLQAVVRTGFWSILPLLGFPAGMITSLLLLHGLYPFFIHTQLIGKLGILEYILVTPSHHRVHHASNEKYLDKNYGDVLIIWDKIFGTFQKEEEQPRYGLTKPLNTYSFLWQHFHFAIELWLAVKSKRSFKEKFGVIFGRPATLDPGLREKAEALFQVKQNTTDIARPLNKYVVIQMAAILLGLCLFIGFEAYSGTTFKTVFTFIVIITLVNCGAIMEQKKWVFQVEALRIFILLLIPFYAPGYFALKLSVLLVAAILFASFYPVTKDKYLHYVYGSG